MVGSVHAALSQLNESVVLHASSPLELVSTLASIVKVSDGIFYVGRDFFHCAVIGLYSHCTGIM